MLTLGSELRAVFLVGGEGGIGLSVRAIRGLKPEKSLTLQIPQFSIQAWQKCPSSVSRCRFSVGR
jgi:hypothetical protein